MDENEGRPMIHETWVCKRCHAGWEETRQESQGSPSQFCRLCGRVVQGLAERHDPVAAPILGQPLHQNALNAYRRGELDPLGRARTRHPESDYEQRLP